MTGKSSTGPTRGHAPSYAFPAIRVDDGRGSPFVSVLEARLQPPYQGAFGLGSQNAPGLQRLQGATFTGEFPLARIAFHDRRVPVRISLEAFSPFIPHDADDSGLPVAVLRYRVQERAHRAGDRLDRVLDRERARDRRSRPAWQARPARQRPAQRRARARSADAQPVAGNRPSACRKPRTLGAERRRPRTSRSCAAGRARAGGRARCTSGTTSRPTARLGPRPRSPAPSPRSACGNRSRPAAPLTTRFS